MNFNVVVTPQAELQIRTIDNSSRGAGPDLAALAQTNSVLGGLGD